MGTTSIAWTNIPSWPKYQVTRDGRVRNATTGHELKLRASRAGHLYFIASRGRKCYAHRAVLEAFVGPCPHGQEARHLDGHPTNNHVSNLAWGTRLENMADKLRHGTQPRGESSRSAKLTEAEVREIRIRVGAAPLRALAAEYGVSHTTIRKAASGAHWSHIK